MRYGCVFYFFIHICSVPQTEQIKALTITSDSSCKNSGIDKVIFTHIFATEGRNRFPIYCCFTSQSHLFSLFYLREKEHIVL